MSTTENKPKIQKVNAFTLRSGEGGNPAGVCLVNPSTPLSTNEMASLAKQAGYSETAFVEKTSENSFKIRFFTPSNEIDNCGHATVASFGYMSEQGLVGPGQFEVETKAGTGTIEVEADTIALNLNSSHPAETVSRDSWNEIISSLNIQTDAVTEIYRASFGVPFLIVFGEKGCLKTITPDLGQINHLSSLHRVIGYYVVETSTNKTECRMFAPAYGIDEESATGMAAAALGKVLYEKRVIEDNCALELYQGQFMNPPSPSLIQITMRRDGSAIEIKGHWKTRSMDS